MRKPVFTNTSIGQRYADQLVKYEGGYKKLDHGEKLALSKKNVTGQRNADQVVRDYGVEE